MLVNDTSVSPHGCLWLHGPSVSADAKHLSAGPTAASAAELDSEACVGCCGTAAGASGGAIVMAACDRWGPNVRLFRVAFFALGPMLE
eukprot:CAMPEP_0117543710 /NCGR_PEP_ID=MMETSP0784-20121206/45200_1 /TAXON_ID=39447 /ORGANISM="" /LENGTH=87 /DNA_ID=CAMNT_0005340495 /DNA_START=232 /DNA_END=492 /DNA_ORIENTATION=+